MERDLARLTVVAVMVAAGCGPVARRLLDPDGGAAPDAGDRSDAATPDASAPDADADRPTGPLLPPDCSRDTEPCDGIDNDGDGSVDEGCPCRGSFVAEQPEGVSYHLTDVAVTGDGRAVAVGYHGVLLLDDGSGWTVQRSGTAADLWAVWASDHEAIAVGDRGTALRFDGCEWSQMDTGTDRWLLGVWGLAPDDVYAVGEEATVLHFDGEAWRDISRPGYDETLSAVWGPGPEAVYVVGAFGLLWVWDGSHWAERFHGLPDCAFYAIEGTPSGSSFLVGGTFVDDPVVLVCDADTFRCTETALAQREHEHVQVTDLHVVSTTEAYAAISARTNHGWYGEVRRFDGRSWSPVHHVPSPLDGIAGTREGPTVAVGYGGVSRCEAGEWTAVDDGHYWDFNAVWASGPSDVYAVGTGSPFELEGSVVHYDGREWTSVALGVRQWWYSVWGSGPSDVHLVGGGSDHLDVPSSVAHFDGDAWTIAEDMARAALLDLWGSGEDDVYAVGGAGLVLHYNGSGWEEADSGTSETLSAVWGSGPDDVHAVGGHRSYPASPGVVLDFDGAGWTTGWAGEGPLSDVWGSGPDDVFAVGDDGVIVHYDGERWSPMDSGTTNGLWSVWGTGPSDVYAVGEAPVHEEYALHYDGMTWSETTLETLVYRPFFVSPADVFAPSHYGVLHRCGEGAWP